MTVPILLWVRPHHWGCPLLNPNWKYLISVDWGSSTIKVCPCAERISTTRAALSWFPSLGLPSTHTKLLVTDINGLRKQHYKSVLCIERSVHRSRDQYWLNTYQAVHGMWLYDINIWSRGTRRHTWLSPYSSVSGHIIGAALRSLQTGSIWYQWIEEAAL